MSTLWLEFKRSSLKWLAPAIAALLVLSALLGMRPGLVLWADVSGSFTQAGSLINPLVGGFVAWEAGRRRGGGFQGRLYGSTRSAMQVRATHVAAICLWLAVPAILTLLGFIIGMAANGAYGAPVLPWILSAALGTFLCAMIGYLAGTLAGPHWFVAPLVAIGLYFTWTVINTPSVFPRWIIAAFPTVLSQSNPFVRYIWSTFVGQALWYVAAATLVFAFVPIVRRRDRITRLTLVLPALVVAVIGLGTIHASEGQITTGYNAHDYICKKSPISICVNRAYAKGLPQLEASFAAFNTRVAGTNLVATKLEHNVMGVGDDPSKGARSLYVENLAPGFADNSVSFYEQAYSGLGNCSDAEPSILHSIVDSWLIGQPSNLLQATGTPEGSAAQRFQGLSESQRNAWLRSHLATVTTCTLTMNDMP